MTDQKAPPERRVVLPVDPARRTEIDKQRVPMSARPYRLLALVKQDAVVRVQKEPDDTVMTWPHLLSIEFLAAVFMSVFLLFMGLFVNAPLEELADALDIAGGFGHLGARHLEVGAVQPGLDEGLAGGRRRLRRRDGAGLDGARPGLLRARRRGRL